MNTVDKVLNIALAEEGYLEKKSNAQLYDKKANAGGGNYTKYNKEMHDIYPSVMDFPAAWCDAFVDWCFYSAYGVCNAKALIGGDFNDYTPSSANLYKKKNAWHTSNAQIGDQIFFKNEVRICHTGLVYAVDANYVYTIEGNSGNAVVKRKYKHNDPSIAGYGRPKYDIAANVEVKPTNTIIGKAVAKESMRVRNGATTSKTTTLGYVKKGQTVEVVEVLTNGWYKIKWNGGFAYTSNAGNKYYVYTSNSGATSSKPSTPTAPTTNNIVAGKKITLKNAKAYRSESATSHVCTKSGTFYLWDAVVKNGRIRITNAANRVGVKGQVICWINVSDI